jgi:LSD1 subclass zinc finger protein
MANTFSGKKVACPTCGTPLLFGPGEITTRCQFCHAVVERPIRPDGPAAISTEARDFRPQGTKSVPADIGPRTFVRFIFILAALILTAVAGIVVFLFSQTASKAGLIFNGPAAVFVTDQPEGPDFIALATQVSSEGYFFLRADPVKGKVVWRTGNMEDLSDVRAIVVDGTKFFAVEKRELRAFRAEDGSELWRTKLSDELGYCDECLSISEGVAVVLTQDYVIEAFDADGGASLWKRRMDGYTGGFIPADGGIWVVDKVGGAFQLLFLDLADGSVQRSIAPECRRTNGEYASAFSAVSMVLLDPDASVRSSARSVYLLYGWHPGCMERWDASSASRIWQIVDDEGFSASSDFAALETPDTLYLAHERTLWAVEKDDGGIRTLADGGDYELVPVAYEQETLIVRTKRMRGTTQFGLRGVDPATGDTIWEYDIENGEPMDPPDAAFPHVDEDRSIWSWRIVDGRIRLFVFQADPNQITFDTLNSKDGTSSGTQTLALDMSYDSYFGPYAYYWKEPVLWVVADSKIIAVDIVAAKVRYHMP